MRRTTISLSGFEIAPNAIGAAREPLSNVPADQWFPALALGGV